MSKTTIAIVLCVVFSLIGLCFAGFIFNGSSIPFLNQLFLSNYNIKNEILPAKPSKGCLIDGKGSAPKWLQERKFIYCLKNEKTKNVVAVIEGKKNGTVILNPRNKYGRSRFNYGPIPESNNLTKSDLDVLFGKHILENGNHVTYKLITLDQSRDKKYQQEAFIDVKFENSKIFQFRLRLENLNDTDWISIQNQGEEV